jgi:hypothetical protein
MPDRNGELDSVKEPAHESSAPPMVLKTRKWWWPRSLSDVAAVALVVLAIPSVVGIGYQLNANNATNRVAVRSQLYQAENGFFEEEGSDSSAAYASLWARVPPQTTGREYGVNLLRVITNDSTALAAGSAEALYHAAYDLSVLADSARRDATFDLRRTFMFVLTDVYHVMNAFDFHDDGVLTYAEWLTWKGIIGEMNSHPVLMAVIWHGYQNRYLSRQFADFLRDELCGRSPHGPQYQARNCAFAKHYYPEMFRDGWSSTLPHY